MSGFLPPSRVSPSPSSRPVASVRIRWLLFAFFTVYASGQATRMAAPASRVCADLTPGIVIERVAKGSEPDKAGMAEGDVILSWSRANTGGEIRTPFDFIAVETEQRPRGRVSLQGIRGGTKQSWNMGFENWELAVRPNLPDGFVHSYLESEHLSDQPQAAERWRKTAAEAQAYRCSWLNAWVLFHAGEQLSRVHQWNDSDELFQQAIASLGNGEPEIEAQVLRTWAASFEQRRKWSEEETRQKQAIAESQKATSESLAIAKSLGSIGFAAYRSGDLNTALDYFQRTLAMREKLAPESLEVAATLNNLGSVNDDRGELAAAFENYHRALTIKQKIHPDSVDTAKTLNNIGLLEDERGELAEAEQYHEQALAIREKLEPESLEVAQSLNNLGNVLVDRGDLAKAEDCFRRSLAIKEKVQSDGEVLVYGWGSLGNLAGLRGDNDGALGYHRRALEISLKLDPKSALTAMVLGNLGIDEREAGHFDLAEKYEQQAVAIYQEQDPGSLNLAGTFDNLGGIAYGRHDLKTAARYYGQALEIRKKLVPMSSDMSASLRSVGQVELDSGDLAAAERDYRQAIDIDRKLAPNGVSYAESLATTAGILRTHGSSQEAATLYSEAIDVMDRQMTQLGGSADVRAEFRAKHAGYYSDYVDLLLEQKKPEIAFEVLERSRARTLLEMLAGAQVDVREGADSSTIEKERLLQATLTAKTTRRVNLLGGDHSEAQLAEVNKEIDDVLAEYHETEDQIRANSPKYASLTQPKTLNAHEIQQLLDRDTALLDYTLGSERSHVFLVTTGSIESYELPKGAEIDSTARHLYQLLTLRNERSAGPATAQGSIQSANKAVAYQSTASELSRMVLPQALSQLESKRLIIVADGALRYIPFGVLPIAVDKSDSPASLVATHEIVYLPSASVLAELRRQAEQRPVHPTREVAVLADPVFESSDPRVRDALDVNPEKPIPAPMKEPTPEVFSSSAGGHLTRSLTDVGATQQAAGLPRLVFSRREAAAIMAIAKGTDSMEALDFQASRETAIGKDLGEYRIVHFATHGLLDNEHPELSGLVLSLVGTDGKPRNGFVDLQDIYNLNLPSDLVVLSACESALGKEVGGEGLVGLTRGFMYAGATRVIASLWPVDDVATSELMGAFYKATLKDGLPPAAALRQAQLQLMRQKRWHDPYYWAAFTLQGEWK